MEPCLPARRGRLIAECGRAGHRPASLGHGQPPPGKAAPPSARARSRSPAPSVTSFPSPSAPTRAVCSASSAGQLRFDSRQPSSLLHQPACDCKPGLARLQRAVALPSCATATAKPTARCPAPHCPLAKWHRAHISQSWRPGAPLVGAGALPARVPTAPCPPFAPMEGLLDTAAIAVRASL